MKFLLVITLLFLSFQSIGQVYTTIDGKVHFISDAPLEVIEADSDQMQGLIDIEKKIFAFKVYIKSFNGFNTPLQQVHFYENYMEANDFPIATFKGKILENITLGKAFYRAKGVLEIHGQKVERIIEVELNVRDSEVSYSSKFVVQLVDHDIELPRIVYQKIAENINISVNGVMIKKE